MSVIALITAGGIGSRTNLDIPKQFYSVNNKPIIVYTLEAFQINSNIDTICVVVLNGWDKVLWSYAQQYNISKLKIVARGGSTNQESIYNGLKKIRKIYKDDDVVMVHDGNRPLISQNIITDSVIKQKKYGDAVATIPCTEAVFVSKNKKSSNNSIPRETLFRTQTPHSYFLGDLWQAHEQAKEKNIENTTASCVLMEKLGKEIHFSLGSEINIKITTIDDIEIFKAILNYGKDEI